MLRSVCLSLCAAALVAAEVPAELRQGTPLPPGRHRFDFPAMAKQSIAFHWSAPASRPGRCRAGQIRIIPRVPSPQVVRAVPDSRHRATNCS